MADNIRHRCRAQSGESSRGSGATKAPNRQAAAATPDFLLFSFFLLEEAPLIRRRRKIVQSSDVLWVVGGNLHIDVQGARTWYDDRGLGSEGFI